jgi:4-amino-4-deoxy-L-arabinose transferase-like glycosyltransferase
MGISERIVGALPLALVALVSVGLRLPFLSVPLITDEAGYAYVAHWLGQGLALYRDLWFDRPQGIFLVYGAQMALLGETTEQLRLGAALYNAATTLAMFSLASAMATRRAAVAAAGLFAVGSSLPQIEGFTGNGELYMNLPLVACLALAARGRWSP